MTQTGHDKLTSLHDAVAEHVRPGDALHVLVGHTRWTAAAREVVRQFWGRDPRFTLVMLSLSSLGTLFFKGGLVEKVVTGYSGDTFPNFTPNPIFARAYERGEVAVEHWSFLAFAQRLEAAVFISGEDIQIHGGVGFTWDCDAHLYYKRAKMNDAMLGYQGWQRRRLADLVLDSA